MFFDWGNTDDEQPRLSEQELAGLDGDEEAQELVADATRVERMIREGDNVIDLRPLLDQRRAHWPGHYDGPNTPTA